MVKKSQVVQSRKWSIFMRLNMLRKVKTVRMLRIVRIPLIDLGVNITLPVSERIQKRNTLQLIF